MVRIGRLVVAAATCAAAGIAVHTAANLALLRRPRPDAPDVTEAVDVLIPARNERDHIERTVRSALAQQGVSQLRVTVLDDDSDDDTASIIESITDERLHLIRGTDGPPSHWLGKPWACMRLGTGASGSVLVFVDADVVLAPFAVRALVELMRGHDLDMAAPYPAQRSHSPLARLVQPLVTWSWAALLPLRWAEGSSRPSLSAANGQVLAMDAAAYREVGGHEAVHDEVIEDVALMRAFKVHGFRCATVDGSSLAECTMYSTDRELVDGYAKSLWNAFGGAAGSVAVGSLLGFTYLVPPIAMAMAPTRGTRMVGAIGYMAGVASRALVARRVGERVTPDAWLQPASITAFLALNLISWSRHRRGANTWKGRPVVAWHA